MAKYSNKRIFALIRIWFAAAGLMAISFLSACGPEAPKRVTILHTNDIHGHFLAEPALWLEDKPLIGGFEALNHYVKQVRDETPDVICSMPVI